MKYLTQAVCVVALALGGGLFAFGNYLSPRTDLANPAQTLHNFEDRQTFFAAAVSRGFGVGFMALGGLGLVVPWINILVNETKARGKVDLDQTTAPH